MSLDYTKSRLDPLAEHWQNCSWGRDLRASLRNVTLS